MWRESSLGRQALESGPPPHPARDARHPLPSGEGWLNMTVLQIVVSGLLLGAVYALFSSGLTLIWGMMNVINFAHGDFVMVGMYTAFVVAVWLHGGPGLFAPAAAILLFA